MYFMPLVGTSYSHL